MTLKPALTAEEWVDEIRDTPITFRLRCALLKGDHALAALCLHTQPFGFTREDVELLDGMDDFLMSHTSLTKRGTAFADLASRIEALLPPEDLG